MKCCRFPIPILAHLPFLLLLSCTSPEPEVESSPELVTFTQLTHTAGELFPDWSPDGQWIAFTSGRAGTPDIFIKPVAGGEAIRITEHPAADFLPRWSPDGEMLLFISDRDGRRNLWTISPFEDESTLRQITTAADSLEGNLFDWAPSGDEIVFTSNQTGNWDLWILPLAGGSARQVTDRPEKDWDPGWSRDGKWIAFNSAKTSEGGDADLWIVPATGGPARQLTTDSKGDYNPRWSPDDQWVTFSSRRGGDWGVWVIPAAGGTPFKVSEAGFMSLFPGWSPDGEQIVYASNPTLNDLWVLPLAGGQPHRVVEGVYGWGDKASWSPDGREIAFVGLGTEGPDIWKTSVIGGERIRLTEGGLISGGFAEWSPDGRSIAFDSNRGGDPRDYTPYLQPVVSPTRSPSGSEPSPPAGHPTAGRSPSPPTQMESGIFGWFPPPVARPSGYLTGPVWREPLTGRLTGQSSLSHPRC